MVNSHTPADASGGAVTLALPTGQPQGSEVGVEKYDGSTNTVSITGSIRGVGSSSLVLKLQFESVRFRADSAGSWWPIAGHKTLSSLQAQFPSTARTRGHAIAGSRLWARCGDSFTAGTGASNAGNTSFPAMLPKLVGMHRACSYAGQVDGGHAGDRSDQLLARVPAIIASSPRMAVVLIGTNDAKQNVTLSTFAGYMQQIVALFQQAGIPLVVGTVPPCASSGSQVGVSGGAAEVALVRQYNLWLRLWAPTVGVPLAEIYGALVDPTTGFLKSTYDSGDGLHPNDAGHLAIAQAFAPFLSALAVGTALPDYPWLVQAKPNTQDIAAMLAQPLMPGTPGAGVVPTGWSDFVGLGGKISGGFTFDVAAPVAGDLPVGQWASMRLNGVGNGSGGIRGLEASLNAASFTAGDQLLIGAYVKCSDAAATGMALKLFDGSLGTALTSQDTFGTATPGPVLWPYTVGAGVTSLLLALIGTVTSAQDITYYLGAPQVFNLTQLGLTGFGI